MTRYMLEAIGKSDDEHTTFLVLDFDGVSPTDERAAQIARIWHYPRYTATVGYFDCAAEVARMNEQ